MKNRHTALLTVLAMLALWLAPAGAFAVNVGDKAPPFAGSSTRGDVQLSDYLGKKNVVLALYFAAFTPV